MIDWKTFYGIQFLISILGIPSNALGPKHSERILNTENIILSMKDFDENNTDDLEIIKDFPESSVMDKRLRKFHRLVRTMKVTEKTQDHHQLRSTTPMAFYPDQFLGAVFDKFVRKNRKRKIRLPKHDKRGVHNGRRSHREKRALTTSPLNTKSDRDLEKQYEDFVAACQRNNAAYKYSDEGKPEENVYDAIKKIMEVNFPKNCTNVTGAGFDAIRCLLIDVRNGEIDKQQLINKISSISIVWICGLLIIVMILWCTKGWCCCCFRCSFCLPNKTIRNIKKYLEKNPPGFYSDPKGRLERYHASAREKELYEILIKSVEQY